MAGWIFELPAVSLQRTKDTQRVVVDVLFADGCQEVFLFLGEEPVNGFFPAITCLISPLSTGVVSEADLTTPDSLASASSLKPANCRQSAGTSLGTTGGTSRCYRPGRRRRDAPGRSCPR